MDINEAYEIAKDACPGLVIKSASESDTSWVFVYGEPDVPLEEMPPGALMYTLDKATRELRHLWVGSDNFYDIMSEDSVRVSLPE
ncbi:hypothetical protein I6E29_00980 [Arcanobacterium haemolyticum]|nr:hypothetical protein [Arcanobacterium haemolyticum]